MADAPQGWALELLVAVARVTQQQGVVFGDGHRLDVGGSIGGHESPLRAIAFIRDRATQPRVCPFGRYALLQMVGVTLSELREMKASSTDAVIRRLADQDPELRTDPARPT
jgi:hypothetical protein